MLTERVSHALEGSQKVLGKRGYELRNRLLGTKVTFSILPIASTLPREQLTSGLHGTWCLDPAPQGQEKAAKTERGVSRASVTNGSCFQNVEDFLKESIFLEEIYKIPVHLSAKKDV